MIVLPLALGGTKLNKHIFMLAKGTQEIMFNDKLSWNQGHAHMKHLWLTTLNPSILVINAVNNYKVQFKTHLGCQNL